MIINKDASDTRSALTKFRVFRAHRCLDRPPTAIDKAARSRARLATESRRKAPARIIISLDRLQISLSRRIFLSRQSLETPSVAQVQRLRGRRGPPFPPAILARTSADLPFTLFPTRDTRRERGQSSSRIQDQEVEDPSTGAREGDKSPKKTVKDRRVAREEEV